MRLVEKILAIEPYSLTLLFDNQEVRKVGFEKRFEDWSQKEDSIFKPLLNPIISSSAAVNEDLKTVEWSNGVDFCPDVLYGWSMPSSEDKKK